MFKKGDKIKVLDNSKIAYGSDYVNGGIYTVDRVGCDGTMYVEDANKKGVPHIKKSEYKAIAKVEGSNMNRQEALIELMKGNTVVSASGGEIYAENLEQGCPKFIFVASDGSSYPLNYGLDHSPFKLKPKTHTIKLDDKEIEISEESYQAFKKQFTEE